MFQTSAFTYWRKEEESKKIISLIKDLDENLLGGISLRLITELCGGSGSGKTQLCLQFCINVQLPEEAGGLGSKAYYVDTNQGFSPYRLKEIAKHMETRCHQTFQKFHKQCTDFKLENILQNISYVYCNNYKDLMAIVLNLRNILNEDKKLKLIVIDSFSFILRQLEDVSLRTRVNYEILTDLQNLALEFDIAIIITNELTTRCIGNNWLVCPALGESHAHKINTRLLLSRDPNEDYHIVLIEKSVLCDKLAFRFKIKPGGIRSVLHRATE
ncbi:DNA repair protein RAD51 homolog 3 [Stomoxys calcitrans]|nr:DNA repair protein RAD51 homolog 3 [Stomoxys calcitrans]XP_059218590.1 DNA repair protein RAD51 homolog 3 [Stomoxys calcitrans]